MKPKNTPRKAGATVGCRQSDQEKVGYCRPPTQHQFKPGQSGNKAGRPRGVKNTDTLVRTTLDQKLTLTISGRARKVSMREAIIYRFAEDALKGNTKSAAFLLQRYDANSNASHADYSSEDDLQIIESFVRQIKESSGS